MRDRPRMPPKPEIEIIVRVHRSDRPLRRAVESILEYPAAGAVVVAHGIDPAELDLPGDPRIRVVRCDEGVGFSGFASNAGLDACEAEFIGLLDSDDYLEPGALAALHSRIIRAGVDGVIIPLKFEGETTSTRSPATIRRTRLDPARDRLFFRTVPAGLYRRETWQGLPVRFEEGVPAGVDQKFSAILYSSGIRIAHFPADPAYVMCDDGKPRVTTITRPLAEHAEAWRRLWHDEHVLAIAPRHRRALAEKFVQVHILGMVAVRPEPSQWREGDFEFLAQLARRVESLEPRLDRGFTRARQSIWNAVLAGDLHAALTAQRSSSYRDWRLPAHATGPLQRNFWARVRIDGVLSRARDPLDALQSVLMRRSRARAVSPAGNPRAAADTGGPDGVRTQIVVPVHTLDRPIRRAVSSVLADPASGAIVVAHNVDPEQLDLPDDARVRVVALEGNPGRPGAAFDAGIAVATAPWVGIMGSDDWYEEGALAAMRLRGARDGADVVVAPLAYQDGARGFVPQTLRRRMLQPARDRLFYRTAPLGIIRTELLQRPEYRFGGVFAVGEDVAVGARLWSGGHSISFDPLDPAYVVGADAKTRTTTTRRPLAEQGAAWLALWDESWVRQLDAPTREALAVKVMRVHVHGAVLARPRPEEWGPGDFAWLSALAVRILDECPAVLQSFRDSSSQTIQALAAADIDRTLAAAARESGSLSLRQLLPSRLAFLLKHDGPVRLHLTGLGYTVRRRLRAFRSATVRTRQPAVGGRATEPPGHATRKQSLLILSFSPLRGDARVLRQINLFRHSYAVTTAGFGEAPDGVVEHIELPADLLPTQLDGRLITLRQYAAAYWSVPAVRNAWKQLRGRSFDAVLANDVEAVPIALRLRTRGVHADLHEHYPSMHDYHTAWRRRISPYMSWLLSRYVTKATSTSTVSGGLRRAFKDQFGLRPDLVPNATPYADLRPSPVGAPVRLVHSGACLRKRQLEVMLEAVVQAAADITLDLFVTPNDPGYLAELKDAYGRHERIRINDPVPYSELVNTLNEFDLGVFVLPPATFSYKWALPNKFFDYVQARLGIIVGPSPEMAPLVEANNLGAVSEGFSSEDLVSVLQSLDPDTVASWKRAADRAAWEMSGEQTVGPWQRAISAIMADASTR
ncbi:glycosyltransferase [Microbacterium sp. Sa1CUA4]|uniref:Glycosyltransferase n=2 Tax=Microbacterium gallinarum TaxID=2762209 RepID=A0ABR8WYU4_9MICO|nr:glycosyltransferase [Microbacterium gallinarum]